MKQFLLIINKFIRNVQVGHQVTGVQIAPLFIGNNNITRKINPFTNRLNQITAVVLAFPLFCYDNHIFRWFAVFF